MNLSQVAEPPTFILIIKCKSGTTPESQTSLELKFIKSGSRVNTAKPVAKENHENHENSGEYTEPTEPTETAYNKLINKIDNDEDWFR